MLYRIKLRFYHLDVKSIRDPVFVHRFRGVIYHCVNLGLNFSLSNWYRGREIEGRLRLLGWAVIMRLCGLGFLRLPSCEPAEVDLE